MSELSPAAKAVDDAFWKTIHNKWNIYDRRRAQLAAALRAVANQGEIFFDAYDSPVQVVTVDDLLAIANELEAQ